MNHNTNKEIVTDEKKLLHDFMQRLFLCQKFYKRFFDYKKSTLSTKSDKTHIQILPFYYRNRTDRRNYKCESGVHYVSSYLH